MTALTNKQIGEYFNIGDTAVIKEGNLVEVLLKEDKQLKQKVNGVFLAFSV
ncbi:MAG: hypothetical protein KAS13_06135 [Candidatus Omnitrophica bacterium]|nr:hypothetical protein [Candidatus Omnitrophota bacterium]